MHNKVANDVKGFVAKYIVGSISKEMEGIIANNVVGFSKLQMTS